MEEGCCSGGMSPVPQGAACSPSWGASMGPLHASATLLRGCRAGGTLHSGHHPGAEAMEKYQHTASNLVGKIKQKVHPGFPCYFFFFNKSSGFDTASYD